MMDFTAEAVDAISDKAIIMLFDEIGMYTSRVPLLEKVAALLNDPIKLGEWTTLFREKIILKYEEIRRSHVRQYHQVELSKRYLVGRKVVEKFNVAQRAVSVTAKIDFRLLTNDIITNEESNLIFELIAQNLLTLYWETYMTLSNQSITSFVKEPSLTYYSEYVYEALAASKLYDLAGYIAGWRFKQLIKYKSVKDEMLRFVKEFLFANFYGDKFMAEADGLPSEYLMFKQHSDGLMFCKNNLFNLIKYVNYVYMSVMSTEVMILFNSYDPPKKVFELLEGSDEVKRLFTLCTIECAGTTPPTVVSCVFKIILQGYFRYMCKI
jgi:hypothetical protein